MSFSGTKGYITKPKPGVMLNPLHPLSRGLVGYWLFNEGSGSRAYDISGKGNHGTLHGNSKWAAGNLEFDGTGDYINFGDKDIFSFPEGFTIIAEVKLDNTGRREAILAKYGSNNREFNFAFHPDTPQRLYGLVYDKSSVGYRGRYIDDNIFTDLKPHTAAMTYDGGAVSSSVKLYIDGIQCDIGDFSSGSFDAMENTSEPLCFGHAPGWYSTDLDGQGRYCFLYNRTLAPWEIKTLHHDPFCNLLRMPLRRYSVAAPPIGAIMNQFQRANLGADLYNGAIIA